MGLGLLEQPGLGDSLLSPGMTLSAPKATGVVAPGSSLVNTGGFFYPESLGCCPGPPVGQGCGPGMYSTYILHEHLGS